MRLLKNCYYYFPLIFFVAIAQGLRRSHGHLRLKHLVIFSVGALILYFVTARERKMGPPILPLKWVILGIQAIFIAFLYAGHEIIYAENFLWVKLLYANLGMYTIYLAMVILKEKGQINFELHNFSYLIIFLLLLNYFYVLLISPQPKIDVYEYARLGADYLLKGINPYTQSYPDLYNGRYELTYGFCYWPLPALAFTLSRWVFTDVRFILCLTYVLSFWGLRKLIWEYNYSNLEKWGLIFIWFTFPVGYFVIEQSWVDIFILPCVFYTAYYLKKEAFYKAALVVGIACSIKQYMIFMAVLFITYVLRRYKLKNALKAGLVLSSATITISLPFLLWDYQLFFKKTVLDLLELGFRDDALSWVAYLSKMHNYYLPGKITGGIYIVTTVFFIVRLLRAKEIKLGDLLSSMFLIYMIVFFFGKQAFCNYYYMASAILFAYIIDVYGKSNLKKENYV